MVPVGIHVGRRYISCTYMNVPGPMTHVRGSSTYLSTSHDSGSPWAAVAVVVTAAVAVTAVVVAVVPK